MRGWNRSRNSSHKGVFDISDTRRVKHTRIGVWDVYEEKAAPTIKLPGAAVFEQHAEVVQCLPYIWRMIKDVLAIPYCTFLLWLFLMMETAMAFMPALTLWFQGQLLHIMQIAIDTRTVDKDHLIFICAGRIACSILTHLVNAASSRVRSSLIWRVRQWSDDLIFRARARLDLPTSETSSVQRQLDDITPSRFMSPVVWDTIDMLSGFFSAATQAVTQVAVLAHTLRGQRDGYLLAGLTLSAHTIEWLGNAGMLGARAQVWAATTTNRDYINMHGWIRVVKEGSHRKELVAGNLGEYAISEYEKTSKRVGDGDSEFDQWQLGRSVRHRLQFWALLQYPLRELPQIFFTLRAVQYPASMPISLASLISIITPYLSRP